MPKSPRSRHLENHPWMVCPECKLHCWTDQEVGRPRRFCSNACRQAAYRRGASGQQPRPLRTQPSSPPSDEGGLFRPPSSSAPGRAHAEPATPDSYAVEKSQDAVSWQTVFSHNINIQGGDL